MQASMHAAVTFTDLMLLLLLRFVFQRLQRLLILGSKVPGLVTSAFLRQEIHRGTV